MSRGSESEGCPSFAEIGQALESLIVENEEDYSQTEALSGEHQYLLSWCWVNIKVFRVSLLVCEYCHGKALHASMSALLLLGNTKCIFYFGQQESCGKFNIYYLLGL